MTKPTIIRADRIFPLYNQKLSSEEINTMFRNNYTPSLGQNSDLGINAVICLNKDDVERVKKLFILINRIVLQFHM